MNINVQVGGGKRERLCIKDFSFMIHSFMMSQMKLKGLELEMFALIYSYSACGGVFTASRYYLANAMCCALSSVDRTLASLVNKGYIRRIDHGVRGVEYVVNVEHLPDNAINNSLLEICKKDKEIKKHT